MGERLWSQTDICKYFNVSKVTIWKWRRDGKLNAEPIKIGNKIMFRDSEVQRFIQKGVENAENQTSPSNEASKP